MKMYCGKITKNKIDQKVVTCGWVKKNRKLGSLIFIDISDRHGMVQVVVEENNPYFQIAEKLTRESVVQVSGVVVPRKSINANMINGDVEIAVESITVLSQAKTTPIIIENETDGNEETRLKYRYLDLRRPINQANLLFRSRFINAMRSFLDEEDFIEIETPILTKPTPEGARDYLIPTRIKPNHFYALPQSPQIYKQLLMVSGMLKYFQVARCFRDEDLRSDRQPEFTQMDMEMSFLSIDEIMDVCERMFTYAMKKTLDIDLKTPFQRMKYEDAINFYGSDKPDLRFDLKLKNANDFFNNTNFNVVKNALAQGGVVKYVFIDKPIEKPHVETLRKVAKDNGAYDLMWIGYENEQLSGNIKNVIEFDIIKSILNCEEATFGMLFLIVGNSKIVNKALGAVRNTLGSILNLKDSENYKFVWITDWPLFELDEKTNRFVAAHHPFTSPINQCLKTFDSEKENAKAEAYDLVLNGFEIGGGSIRITDRVIQKRMFSAIGLKQNVAEDKFGFLLDAFEYGVPPHGGIAFGLDRIIMLLTNSESIRDVIAFPKNSSGIDTMMNTPTSVSVDDLTELHLEVKKIG